MLSIRTFGEIIDDFRKLDLNNCKNVAICALFREFKEL
jgi:hypothetical protein